MASGVLVIAGARNQIKRQMKKIFKRFLLLLTLVSSAAFAQFRQSSKSVRDEQNYFAIGTQIPFQHSLIYGHYFSPAFSVNAGIGLITTPYTGVIFNGLESKGLISDTDRKVIDRTFMMGISYQVGANFHFNKNYIRAFGQLATLRGNLTYTDLANLYLKMNIPPISRFLSPIQIRSTVPMIGVLYGRSFTIGDHSEIHIEGSISKTLGHHTTYRTNTFLDNIGAVNQFVYTGINNDLDTYFNKYGWLPSLNVYYVYKF
jgi:hypothetical protein